jgi:hypothetical protein
MGIPVIDDPQGPDSGHEEPPLIQGLFARGWRQFEDALRRALAGMDRGLLLVLLAVATLVVFFATLLLGVSRSPGLSGVLSGGLIGLFTALLFAAGGAWFLMWGLAAPAEPAPFNEAEAKALEALLAPTLREIGAARAEVVRRVKERSVIWVPLGTAAAVLLWLFFYLIQWGDEPTGVAELIVFGVVGALAGQARAAGTLPGEYRRLYKDRVLPQLAARFGGLTYRQVSDGSVQVLRSHRILKDAEEVVADDEIAGAYRGVSLSIVQVRATRGSGDDVATLFDGLVIDLALPWSLTGTTVIAANGGLLENLAARIRSDGLRPVRLGDPSFEARYRIHATDQMEARALLTPAFTARFTALADRSSFSLPGAVAEGNHFVLALPKRARVNLFEPPHYWEPAGGRALVALTQDIAAVLAMADAVIDLDVWTRGSQKNS